ncbi:MAG TPA: helix-turn-helix transcriptional regulator [Frankiaceae bacterium]|jgi:predicted transcriptional regulator|nr:helix-turn-helix transcriptional regulator [Frankiaceae bacterium]
MRDASDLLRYARRRASLSQRALAERAGVPQSTVARIESGAVDPSVSLLARLLRACDAALIAIPGSGEGIDRSLIRSMLARSPEERLATVPAEAEYLRALDAARPA